LKALACPPPTLDGDRQISAFGKFETRELCPARFRAGFIWPDFVNRSCCATRSSQFITAVICFRIVFSMGNGALVAELGQTLHAGTNSPLSNSAGIESGRRVNI
jgi:hypothetical protein